MAMITVQVWDATGNKRQEVELPDDAPVNRILAVLLDRFHRAAVAILALLTIIFIIASAVARIRGIDISCGCFGHLSNHLSFAWHLGLDTVLLALLFALWRSKHLRRAITV